MIKIQAKDSKNKVDNLEYVEPEIWKEINGYDGMYEVSNKGRVRSWKNNRWGRVKGGKASRNLKLAKRPNGYLVVCLVNKDGDRKTFLVHRLVAQAFIPNPKNKPQINHKDGDKKNNHYKNLEWCTSSENIKHSYKIGILCKKGVNHHLNKLSEQDVYNIVDLLKKGCTQKEVSEIYKVDQAQISRIKNGKAWGHLDVQC